MPGSSSHTRTATTLLFAALLLLAGCGPLQKLNFEFSGQRHQSYAIDSTLVADSLLNAYISPYRSELYEEMDRVLVTATGDFTEGRPEGPLGNLIADILRRRAALLLNDWVDVGLMNGGGIRRPLYAGEVRVGDIYEMLPFENTLVILTMNGRQLQQLADEIAATGGEPISGMRMRMSGGKATDIIVGSRTVEPDSTYLVATNNYLADGGGRLSSLWKPLERMNTGLSVREIVITYLNDRQLIRPKVDYRIR